MPRLTRIIRVDDMNPFLVTDLEMQGAYEMARETGLYVTSFAKDRCWSPLMPWDWWWVPALAQGTWVLAQEPWGELEELSRPGS